VKRFIGPRIAFAALLLLAVGTATPSVARAEGGAGAGSRLDWTIAAAGAAPTDVRLDLWGRVMLGRYLAVDGMVRRYARHYGLDYLWTVLPFASESILNPLAKGPQPDDRGIGQVGYAAEDRCRERGTLRRTADYHPDFNPGGSIWEPRFNIICAGILFRWIYHQPYVTSPQKAYAVYTEGLEAVRPDGTLSYDAKIDIARARSHRPAILSFMRLKRSAARLSPAQLEAQVGNPVTRAALIADRRFGDGARVYARLREAYIAEASATKNGWVLVTYAREAVTFTDLSRRVYGNNEGSTYRALLRALVTQRPIVGHDPALLQIYLETLETVEDRVAQFG
jgi:hypothetical protein